MSKYGEPLHIEQAWMGRYLCGQAPNGRPNGEGVAMLIPMGAGLGKLEVSSSDFANRIIDCVNACAEMENPSKEIARLRRADAALTAIVGQITDEGHEA